MMMIFSLTMLPPRYWISTLALLVCLVPLAKGFVAATPGFLSCRCRCPSNSKFLVDLSVSNSNNDNSTSGARWFVKTETFSKPYPLVKPFLQEHREWVAKLRKDKGMEITSGYRVDAEGKPGGGGMMFFRATDYQTAKALVLEDPLIRNDCVDWRLNEWIAEVGGIQLL